MTQAEMELQKLQEGVKALGTEQSDMVKAFSHLAETVKKDGHLPVRVKELIAIGISIQMRCHTCTTHHVQKALEAGCTRGEILEAAGVAMLMGGGPVFSFIATTLLEVLDELEK